GFGTKKYIILHNICAAKKITQLYGNYLVTRIEKKNNCGYPILWCMGLVWEKKIEVINFNCVINLDFA
ncbi:hypothetical protein ACJX0J_020027, partial [Zea mays]